MKQRFTIRSLLILTLLVALFFAFPFREASKQQQGREWVAQQRGHVSFQYAPDWKTGQHSIPWIPNLVVDLVGVDMFNPVVGVMLDCEMVEELDPLTNLTSLESFAINIEMTDGLDFTPLLRLPNLKELHFTEWSCLTRHQLGELQEMLPNVKIYSEFDSEN